jgi:hypothetical protein
MVPAWGRFQKAPSLQCGFKQILDRPRTELLDPSYLQPGGGEGKMEVAFYTGTRPFSLPKWILCNHDLPAEIAVQKSESGMIRLIFKSRRIKRLRSCADSKKRILFDVHLGNTYHTKRDLTANLGTIQR